MTAVKREKALLTDIKRIIVERALKDHDKDRTSLAEELIKEIERNYPRKIPPKLETVIKLISKARVHEKKPEDKAWTILSLGEHPVLPEAIPTLLEIQNSESIRTILTIEDMPSKEKISMSWAFTVRQAKWASRLYPTIRGFNEGKSQFDMASILYKWAKAYADREKVSEIVGRDIDSAYLDHRLFVSHGEGMPFETEDDELVYRAVTDAKTWEQ